MRREMSVFAIATLTLAVVLGASSRAEASFIAYICDDAACSGGGDIAVIDNSGSDLLPGINGAILVSFATGGFDITLNTSQSKPVLGSADQPTMDLNYTATKIFADGTTAEVWLYASDTDFTGVVTATLENDANGLGTVNTSLFGGNSNTNLDLSNLLIALFGFNDEGTAGLGLDANPYSLTLLAHITAEAAGTTTGDLLLTSVPEPASVLMLGLGLLGSAAAMRRRFGAR